MIYRNSFTFSVKVKDCTLHNFERLEKLYNFVKKGDHKMNISKDIYLEVTDMLLNDEEFKRMQNENNISKELEESCILIDEELKALLQEDDITNIDLDEFDALLSQL